MYGVYMVFVNEGAIFSEQPSNIRPMLQSESERLNEWQIDVSSHIIRQVDTTVLLAVPEFIGGSRSLSYVLTWAPPDFIQLLLLNI